jgi:hypothetical protein
MFKNKKNVIIKIMRPIPDRLKQEMASDEYYSKCARCKDGHCSGRITWEHAIIHAGRQLNEKWAIIPLCEYHHGVNQFQDGGDLKKEKNIWIALNRATDQQLIKYSKAIDYIWLRDKLNKTYGEYKNPFA